MVDPLSRAPHTPIRTIADEIKWLTDHPQFEERPATLLEFLGPDYLNIADGVRDSIKRELAEILGHEVNPNNPTKYHLAMFTGAIGIGKTTVASIVLPYLAHWCLCLKNPQEFFGLLPGSRIAMMMMSTSESQAKEVLFSDVKARVQYSPWFKKWPHDPAFKNQIRFPKDIWVIPGDSRETTFEGYNICLDEETTILTSAGWKRYDELREGDLALTLNHSTGLTEWQAVQRVNIMPAMPRLLTSMESATFSALATGDHRWAVVTESGVRKWRTTDTFGYADAIPLAGLSADRPTEPKYTDAFVEAVAWFWTEGTYFSKTGVGIYQQSGINAERIGRCLTAVFGPPSPSLPTTSSSRFAAPAWRVNRKPGKNLIEFRLSSTAGKTLHECAPGKVPTHEFLLSLTQAQLDLFIETSLLADNCGDGVLAQKNHAAAEAFAFACILAGHSVSIRPHKTPGRDYDMLLVRIMKRRSFSPIKASRKGSGPRQFAMKQVEHDGIVWCPTLPNGTWLARRNGSVYFTGNCGGILDEADSHLITDKKDYAQQGFDTIFNRMTSRFGTKGFLLVIGQMKSATGFASRIYDEFLKRDDAYAVRMTIWESFGRNHYKDASGQVNTFFFDTVRKQLVPNKLARVVANGNIIEVPLVYKDQFLRNPEKALKDLAGIPPAVGDPFIALDYKIREAVDRWQDRYGEIAPVDESGKLAPWFVAQERLPRVAHIDLAYCVDDETEIFTNRGWLRRDELRVGDRTLGLDPDTHVATWTDVTAVNVFPAMPRQMLEISGKGHSSLTTEAHRWLVRERIWDQGRRTYEGDRRAVVLSRELSGRHKIVAAAPVSGLPDQPKYADDFVELVAWFWTEGHIMRSHGKQTRHLNICQSHERNSGNCARIRSCLASLYGGPVDRLTRSGRRGHSVPEWRERRNGHKIEFYLNSVIGEQILAVAPNRVVSMDFITSLTKAQLELFLHVSVLADGSSKSEIAQKDHASLNAIQAACVLLGYRTNKYELASGMTMLSFHAKSDVVKVNRRNMRWVEHDGHVWCPTTATGSWLARRNGKTFFTGNSGDGDALGFAMGHVREMVEVDNEFKPYIVIDLLLRVKAPGGSEIFLGDIRRFIYMLRDERKFKLQVVTMDGFESTDTRQQLERKRFIADYVSMDKQLLPYYDLREAIYENRIEIPPYFVRTERIDGSPVVEIAYKELSELVDNGKKVDHPVRGSKDVADALAGVVFTLMGDRRYHRRSVPAGGRSDRVPVASGSPFAHPAYLGDTGLPALPAVTSTGLHQL